MIMKTTASVILFCLIVTGLMLINACDPPEITSAKVYFQQNNIKAAEEQLLLAIQKYPENSQAPLLLATNVYRPQKQYEKAKAMLLKAKTLDPTLTKQADDNVKGMWAEIHTEGANLFNGALKAFLPIEKDSLLHEAAQKFEYALQFKDDEIITYNGLAKCYFLLTDSANVEKVGQRMFDKNLYDKDIVNYYFLVSWKPARQSEVLDKLSQLITTHPNAPELLVLKIQFLSQMEKFEEALEIGKKLLEDDPNNLDIVYIIAQLYQKLGNYAEAKYQYQRVVSENPKDVEILIRVTEAVFNNKDWVEAEDYARRVIDLDPNSVFGYEVLWKSLYNQGKKDEAEKYRKIAKSLE